VTLTTGSDSESVSQGGQPVPVYLLAVGTDASDTSCPLRDEASAKVAGATLLGTLTWDHATGVVRLAPSLTTPPRQVRLWNIRTGDMLPPRRVAPKGSLARAVDPCTRGPTERPDQNEVFSES
jgi:hypothetical protein